MNAAPELIAESVVPPWGGEPLDLYRFPNQTYAVREPGPRQPFQAAPIWWAENFETSEVKIYREAMCEWCGAGLGEEATACQVESCGREECERELRVLHEETREEEDRDNTYTLGLEPR